MSTPKRFIVKKTNTGVLNDVKIIIDTHTGVQYLFAYSGYAGGLTILVDQNGKPLIDQSVIKKD